MAFDLVGERKRTLYRRSTRTRFESYLITLRNHKSEPVDVTVIEHPETMDWRITQSSTKYEKIDVNTVEFPVQIPANSEREVTYTIQYRW